jgi:hypothetical protein
MRKLIIRALVSSWLVILSSTASALDVIQITDNSVHDLVPAISGSNVVWYGCEGGTGWNCSGGDFEIYLWDGVTGKPLDNGSSL